MVKLVLDVFQTTRNFGCLTLREMQSLFFVISEEGISWRNWKGSSTSISFPVN